MLLMKFEYLQVFSTKAFVLITKLLLMSHLNPCGKFGPFSVTFSIVMEFADQGDLY